MKPLTPEALALALRSATCGESDLEVKMGASVVMMEVLRVLREANADIQTFEREGVHLAQVIPFPTTPTGE